MRAVIIVNTCAGKLIFDVNVYTYPSMFDKVPPGPGSWCRFFPPTAPPTAAPTMTNTMIVATTRNVFTFMPKMMRGGRLSFS